MSSVSGSGSEHTRAPGPRVGVDEWVDQHEQRFERSPWRKRLDRIPQPALFASFLIAAAVLPLLTGDKYILRVGFDTLLYMLLGLGLNVVVGWAGLLDLGYIAFYGIGAYTYAMLASPKFGLHWPTPAVVLIVVAVTGIVGFLVGLPSRRLVGDYLAIVTLFFGQLFVTVYNNGNRISILGFTKGRDITGGPNGIANVDPFHLFGHTLSPFTVSGYYWTALGFFAIVLAGLHLLDRSRTGRAWRSLRDDALAAELMGMPVNRLKLTAFAFGAAIAGLTGTLFAALNTAVFSNDFDVPLLITIYAMVILGGAGQLKGVVVGAILVNVALEVLRTPDHATWIFYGFLLVTVAGKVRPRLWAAIVLAGTIGFGFAIKALTTAVWPGGTKGTATSATGPLGDFLTHWVVLATNPRAVGNWAFIALIAVALALTTLNGWLLRVALVPALYLAAFVWQNRLADQPSITRLLFLGALLITLMNARPQGILGTAQAEVA
jgi:branched-chain amino acid transport system permease protein